MLWDHKGKDTDPDQVVPEEVSLGQSLQGQVEKGPPHQGMSVQKDERDALGKALLASWGRRREGVWSWSWRGIVGTFDTTV